MFNSQHLIAKARADTGLTEFGSDYFREGLERLVGSLNTEAHLNDFGAGALQAQIIDLLGQRLRVENWFTRHPEIEDEEIVTPLIGLGLPRTGSTALACMLGEDERTRSLRTWETMNPTPPPAVDPDSIPPRIALAQASMERRTILFPRMQQMLPSTATSPTECQLFMAHDFKSQIFQAFASVPSYVEWLEMDADLEPTYRYLRRVLKLLQWRSGRKQWRLKNPAHCLFISALDKVFPDARYVMTHRDVTQVIPSVSDVYFELSSAYCDHVDAPAIAAMNIRSWERAMRRMIAFRDSGHQGRFFDIPFVGFMRDPFAHLYALYAWLGEALTPETRVAMQNWRETAPRDKHGRHEVDLAAFEIDLTALRDTFAFYTARFPDMLGEDA